MTFWIAFDKAVSKLFIYRLTRVGDDSRGEKEGKEEGQGKGQKGWRRC